MTHLGLSDQVTEHTAGYGHLPDLSKTSPESDILFTWNGTTSGVKVSKESCAGSYGTFSGVDIWRRLLGRMGLFRAFFYGGVDWFVRGHFGRYCKEALTLPASYSVVDRSIFWRTCVRQAGRQAGNTVFIRSII